MILVLKAMMIMIRINTRVGSPNKMMKACIKITLKLNLLKLNRLKMIKCLRIRLMIKKVMIIIIKVYNPVRTNNKQKINKLIEDNLICSNNNSNNSTQLETIFAKNIPKMFQRSPSMVKTIWCSLKKVWYHNISQVNLMVEMDFIFFQLRMNSKRICWWKN